ncbi:hypothetical protein BLNAU_12428 [Blattamonas nauphoetae]|uniref:Uncharacterized protein n=1 Tax=Blattamonas nauphoetae TaxID=2049346 RepID=A0ABQ9XQZ7_9EUKA|nr:hypothetical protein BLNAU_12428 [Blattamonas nauphoetae]
MWMCVARRAARIVRRSAASGLADLEAADHSDGSDWIRQCSYVNCPSHFRLSNRQSSNTMASVWVIGFVRFDRLTMTCRFSFRVLPRLRTNSFHPRRVFFPLHILPHSPSSVPSSAPSTQPSPFPPRAVCLIDTLVSSSTDQAHCKQHFEKPFLFRVRREGAFGLQLHSTQPRSDSLSSVSPPRRPSLSLCSD